MDGETIILSLNGVAANKFGSFANPQCGIERPWYREFIAVIDLVLPRYFRHIPSFH
jgi:hypothetical protein